MLIGECYLNYLNFLCGLVENLIVCRSNLFLVCYKLWLVPLYFHYQMICIK